MKYISVLALATAILLGSAAKAQDSGVNQVPIASDLTATETLAQACTSLGTVNCTYDIKCGVATQIESDTNSVCTGMIRVSLTKDVILEFHADGASSDIVATELYVGLEVIEPEVQKTLPDWMTEPTQIQTQTGD